MTLFRSSAIFSINKLALTEKNPLEPPREGRTLVKASCGECGCTTPEPPGTTGTGNARYSVHKRRSYDRKQGGTVEYFA